MPALSIITINLNNAAGLKKTIESVVGQTFKDYEYIVIDGGSTDGSVEVMNAHKGELKESISEKDSGIYNAMNKGIRFATGEYCLFLNSGDYLYKKDVLENVFKAMDKEGIVYGDMIFEKPDGTKEVGKMPDTVTLEYMVKDTIWHPVSFIKRELFTKYGGFKEDLKIASDYDFFLKTILFKNVSTKHLPLIVSVYPFDGISSQEGNFELIKRERRQIQLQYIDRKELNVIEKEGHTGYDNALKQIVGTNVNKALGQYKTLKRFCKEDKDSDIDYYFFPTSDSLEAAGQLKVRAGRKVAVFITGRTKGKIELPGNVVCVDISLIADYPLIHKKVTDLLKRYFAKSTSATIVGANNPFLNNLKSYLGSNVKLVDSIDRF
jgi:glycosyltransferase involved in cell wall biosynthesis